MFMFVRANHNPTKAPESGNGKHFNASIVCVYKKGGNFNSWGVRAIKKWK